jgi:hypothetical protein
MLNRLADIEAKGRETAFEQARAQFEADRGYRSGQIGTQAELASGLAGLGGIFDTGLLATLATA